jgi:hypothetical protein
MAGAVYGDGERNEGFGVTTTARGELAVQGWGPENDFAAGVDGVDDGFLVHSAILENDATAHYRNGELIDEDNHVFVTDPQRLLLGAELADLGQSRMGIAAVLIYDRALTELERQQVEAYLQNKYLNADANTAPQIITAGTVTVDENTIGVVDVDSVDDGDGEGGGLSYAVSGGVDAALFTVDATTGALRFAAAPDFEAPGNADGDGLYRVEVTVTDEDGLSDVQSFEVRVADVAEPPVISDQAFALDETQAGVIGTVVASDPDADTSLSYAIISGNEDGLFAIDTETGELSAVRPLDFESATGHTLTVTVGDGGATRSATVSVAVGDLVEDQVSNLTVNGTVGSDLLVGGLGNDTLTGDTGADRFVASFGDDTVTDFVLGEDTVGLELLTPEADTRSLAEFIQILQVGNDAQIAFDAAGNARFATPDATLTLESVDVDGLSVSELLANGDFSLS